MNVPYEDLVSALRAAGCPHPELVATSEHRTGRPQVAIFAVCMMLWHARLDADEWLSDRPAVNELGPKGGAAVLALLDAGGHPQDLRDLVEAVETRLVRKIVRVLDEGAVGDGVPDELRDLRWSLVETSGEAPRPMGLGDNLELYRPKDD